MGSSSWSADFYNDRQAVRAKTGQDAFAHNHNISSGKVAAEAHAKMSPRDARRESRDSSAHPNSIAIGVMLDVTGSLANNPRIIQANLPTLLKGLEGVVEDPQILFGAVGDAKSDRASLQVGQFESGIEMDDDLSRFYLEGNGGGNGGESYELAIYWFARHTSIDCMEKRNKKGYLFIIGDEPPHAFVEPAEVESVLGSKLASRISVEAIVKECQEKYNIFFLIPNGSSHSSERSVEARWAKLLGAENVMHFNSTETSSVIARHIARVEAKTAGKKADVSPQANVVRL